MASGSDDMACLQPYPVALPIQTAPVDQTLLLSSWCLLTLKSAFDFDFDPKEMSHEVLIALFSEALFDGTKFIYIIYIISRTS